jgi:FAD/FMN-containing dehydrogenase
MPAMPAPDLSIADLRAAIRGAVITADDPAYDEARSVFVGGIDRRPLAIVRVADADDVAQVIRLARETDLPLAVRSGGHSGAGHGVVDDGLVIDLRDLDELELDVDGRTAWAGAGLTAAEYSSAAGAHGLATGFGDTGSVGLGGITLGGGIGYLVRAQGMTIDSLLAADVVTADGELVRVDADTHPDLFWAIRGGGGNFGVVTRFQLRLHPVERILGGLLILPATAETVAGFIAASEAAPETVTTIANVMPCPPMPFVAEEHHGKIVILGIMCHAGGGEDGERALAPFRALADPLADMVHESPYAEIYPPEDPDYRPLAISRTMFVDSVDRNLAARILERLEASDASMRVAQLRVIGGAMARVPADATAFAHRGRRILVNVASFYDGLADKSAREAWVEDLTALLRGDDHAAYVNFINDEGEDRVHDAYPPATWDRLAEIKARYDPDNLFRRNQNVPPGGPR